MKPSKIYNLISIVVISSFILGFTFFENSSGGGRIDSETIFKNYLLFEYNKFYSNFPWIDYKSTSLPLYYILSSFFFEFQIDKDLRIFNFILSIFAFFSFYKLIILNFQRKKINFEIFQLTLLSTILLLSPYFRTSTFWGLEEITGIFFLIITLYFYELYDQKDRYHFLVLCIFMSCMCFLARQSYAFLLLFIFLNTTEKNKIFSKKNFVISLCFFIFLLPSLLFFYEWKHIFPPNSILITDRFKLFKIQNLSFILNIILIYTIPFIFFSQNIIIKLKRCLIDYKFFLILSLLLIYLSLFNIEMPSNGGGAILKILQLLFQNEYLIKVIFSLTSLFSLIIIISLSKFSKKLKIFFPIIIIIFLNIAQIYQEYFDPIIFIFMILYFPYNLINKNIIRNFPLFITGYFSLFLISAIIYYQNVL